VVLRKTELAVTAGTYTNRCLTSESVREEIVAIAIYLTPSSMSAAQYDEVMSRLDAAGAGAPAGRLYHTCFGSGDKLQLFEIWESQQDFGKSIETTMPILKQIGLDLGRPMVGPVHKIIPGPTVSGQ
jgi:hypothetical protein